MTVSLPENTREREISNGEGEITCREHIRVLKGNMFSYKSCEWQENH